MDDFVYDPTKTIYFCHRKENILKVQVLHKQKKVRKIVTVGTITMTYDKQTCTYKTHTYMTYKNTRI